LREREHVVLGGWEGGENIKKECYKCSGGDYIIRTPNLMVGGTSKLKPLRYTQFCHCDAYITLFELF
jgi:hypothetical protein